MQALVDNELRKEVKNHLLEARALLGQVIYIPVNESQLLSYFDHRFTLMGEMTRNCKLMCCIFASVYIWQHIDKWI